MFEQLLADLARALDEAAIPYMVIGGQAVLLYGEPRLTRDVDVTLGLGPDGLDAVLRLAERLGLTPLVEEVPSFVAETMVLPCGSRDTELRVDFIFSDSEYEREALRRVHRAPLGDTDVRFASREDLLIHKIVAGRPRDIEDARGVLLKAEEVDVAYVRRWLAAFAEALGQPFLDTFETLYRETR